MRISRFLSVGAVVVVVATVAVGVVLGVRAMSRDDAPAAPRPASSAPADGASSTRLPAPDPSYWTPERMRSAQPAPMPPDRPGPES